MLIKPSKLSLIVTHKCTAACEHCCFHCTPKIETRIPEQRLREIIDEAIADLPYLKIVVFTGGECFLLPELDERIAQVTRHGLATRCVTNGYWAFNPDRAAKRVSALKAAGLCEINFSTGKFHGQYVPLDRIAYGARACTDAGILSLLNVETCNEEDDTANYLREHPLIKDMIASGDILFQQNVWIENGGETDLSHKDDFNRFRDDMLTGCQTAMDVLAVTPTMSLVACCGLHLEKIPELHIGSIAGKRVGDVVNEAEDDFMKIWLRMSGPERIYNFAAEKDPSISLPTSSPHPCETCLKLFKDKKALEVLSKHYKEKEGEVVSMYMADILLGNMDRAVRSKTTPPAEGQPVLSYAD